MPYIHPISPEPLTLEVVCQLIADDCPLTLSDDSRAAVVECHAFLQNQLREDDVTMYGVNTGFGALCDKIIPADQLAALQRNLITSHACGAGDPMPHELVRLMLLLKIQSLAYGHSGVAPETLDRLIAFYNTKAVPEVFVLGSLGASGDLAPLAHLCLPLIGLGRVWTAGAWLSGEAFLAQLEWQPLTLGPKEGLALLNGVQFMSAYGVAAWRELEHLALWADVIAALSLAAYDGLLEPFHPSLQAIRPHPGARDVAARLHDMLSAAPGMSQPKKFVQDPYSFRCVAQVHGATRDAFDYLADVLTIEINSVSDNPNIFPNEGVVLSGGNFHGQSLALAFDFAALAAAQLAGISERRTYQLLSGARGLPPFLTPNAGTQSGFMILQYTAAAVVNEMSCLAHPHSAHSLPSSNGQEDFVSMGANAGVKLWRQIDLLRTVLAIELLHATQALEFRPKPWVGPVLGQLCTAFRDVVPFAAEDRVFAGDIQAARRFIDAFPVRSLVDA